MAMGLNETTGGPQVLVHVSNYQDSILGTYFSPTGMFQGGMLSKVRLLRGSQSDLLKLLDFSQLFEDVPFCGFRNTVGCRSATKGNIFM